MNDTITASSYNYYLYALPDGSRRVFHVRERQDGHVAVVSVLCLCDKTPLDPDSRYDGSFGSHAPADLVTSGERIAKEKMRELTGHYLEGAAILESVLSQLERVRKDDRYAPFIQALWNMIDLQDPSEWGSRPVWGDA